MKNKISKLKKTYIMHNQLEKAINVKLTNLSIFVNFKF